MTAPLALDFRAQFQHILESAKVELCIIREASRARHAEFIILGRDFRSQMILVDQQIDDLLLIGGSQQPALRFNAGREKRNRSGRGDPSPRHVG